MYLTHINIFSKVKIISAFTTLLILIVFQSIGIGQTITLKGKTVSTKSKQPIEGVLIKLSTKQNGKTLTTVSDIKGEYNFKNISVGEYKLKTKCIGYNEYEKHIELKGSETQTIEIVLTEIVTNLEDVSVFSKLNQESDRASRLNEKNATNIINVVSAKAMERSPDINAANVLQRISGVTLQKSSSADEAYAIIRGLEPRYNNTLINGVKITSPDDKARYVSLDIIPSDLLQKIEISKTLLPEMEGDAIGGTVNLIMKEAPDSLLLKATGSIGYPQIFFDRKFTTFSKSDIQKKSYFESHGSGAVASGTDFSRSNLDFKEVNAPVTCTAGITFGSRFLKNKLGIIIADNYQNQYFGSNSPYNQINPNPTTSVPEIDEAHNRTFSTQQLNNGLSTNMDYIINDKNKIVVTNVLLYSFLAQARVDIDTAYVGGNGGRTVPGTGPVTNDHTSITNFEWLENLKISGKHILNKHFYLDWAGVYSSSTRKSPDRADLSINSKIDSIHSTNNINGPYTFRQTPWYFDGITRSWQHNEDKDYNGIINLTYKLKVNENPWEIKVGGLYRQKDRANHQDDYNLKPSPNADGSKPFFTNIYTARWYVFNPSGSGNYNPNNYTAHENIIAGYAQIKIMLHRLDIFGGLRIENTDEGFNINVPSLTQINSDAIVYTDLLPSVLLKYKIDSRNNLRVSYFKSLARPNYYELVPYGIPSQTSTTSQTGNPYLKHTIADNFDIRYEFFPKDEDELLVGMFYKKLQNPIENVLLISGRFSDYVQPQNAGGDATVIGGELAYTKFYGKFGLSGNYTYIYSNVKTPKNYVDPLNNLNNGIKMQNRPLQGQTDNTLNVSLLYRNTKKSLFVQLAYQYLGKELTDAYPYYGADFYRSPQSYLSLSAEKGITKHFIAFGKFNNLLNSKTTNSINGLPYIGDTFLPNYSIGARFNL